MKHKPITVTVNDHAVRDVLAQMGKLTFAYPNGKIWNTDGISLQRRLDDATLEPLQVNTLLDPEHIKQYVVEADLRAPTRCIDGRITKDWVPSTHDVLGPKIAGGTAHAALTHRVVDFGNLKRNLLFESDIRAVIKLYKERGIGFGGHIDDHQTGPNTGCGAVDNINLILDRLQLPEPQEQLRGLTRIILGNGYDASITSEMIGRLLYLDSLKPVYMPREDDDPTGEFLYKRTIVETIRNEARSSKEIVPSLTGTHKEIALIINFRQNTTFDTDRFSFDTDNTAQVFVWDAWEMYEEARALYPYNMHDKLSVQRETIENRVRHITTRTLLSVATTMVLTDGSLKLITVQ